MKPDCPFLKKEAVGGKERLAKASAKGASKGRPQEGAGGPATPGDGSVGSGACAGAPSKDAGQKVDKKVIENAAAEELMTEVASLMKSLRAMKAIQLRYLEASSEDDERSLDERKVALVDGGATHALRRGTREELAKSSPITVELAKGSTTLFKMPGCSTLFAEEDVEPIIPVRLLIDHGYQIRWDKAGCVITHPLHGSVKSWRRSGCPVMERDAGLRLLRELEEKEQFSEMDDEAVTWWRNQYPQVPVRVWDFMRGQGRHWKSCSGALPWNRHKRRQIESAKGVILHVFSGGGPGKQHWKDLERDGWVVLTLDILANANEDIHSPALWAYLWHLAKSGKLKVGPRAGVLQDFDTVNLDQDLFVDEAPGGSSWRV